MPTCRVRLEREVLKDHQGPVDLEEVKVIRDQMVHLELRDSRVHLDYKVHLVPKEARVLQELMGHWDHQGLLDHQELQAKIFLLHNQLILKDQLSSTLLRQLLTGCLEQKQLHRSLITWRK